MEAAPGIGYKKYLPSPGAEGRAMGELADVLLNVPSVETPRIQEMHIFLGHTLCEIVESALCATDC